MVEISVVVPVYKASDCLLELYSRLTNTISKITDSYEIIMVEDCGGDGSWEILRDLVAKDPKILAIQLSRNFGQHYAITAGLDNCSGKWVVIMDCDLQDQPEEIPNLYAKALEGFDVVVAKRKLRKDKFFKRLFSKIFYSFHQFLVGIDYDAETGNFRIISRNVVDGLMQIREQLRFLKGMMAWMGFSTTNVEVQHAARFSGKSSYNFKKLRRLAIDAILAYSDKPLRLMIKFGFLVSFLSFSFGLYIIWNALSNHQTILGWSSLITSIYFMGGIMITMIGVVAIYLGKVFDETKKRPLYIISKKLGAEVGKC